MSETDLPKVDDLLKWLIAKKYMATPQKHLFALFCARQASHLLRDPRSVQALNVKELWVYGMVSDDELADATCSAWAAWDEIWEHTWHTQPLDAAAAGATANDPHVRAAWAAAKATEIDAEKRIIEIKDTVARAIVKTSGSPVYWISEQRMEWLKANVKFNLEEVEHG